MKRRRTITAGEAEKGGKLFSKKQLASAEKFSDKRDMLNALLEEEKSYTADEAEKIISDYMKGQVK